MVKRYEEHPDGGMREDELGSYVRWEDFQNLQDERARMEAIIWRVVENAKKARADEELPYQCDACSTPGYGPDAACQCSPAPMKREDGSTNT